MMSQNRRRLALAWLDLSSGFSQWWMWGRLGIQDIRMRYRGSVLGPFWITLSLALTVGTLGALYSRLLHVEMRSFLPYLCLGYLGWSFIASVINENCGVFIVGGTTMKQTKLPFSSYVLQTVWRNVLVFLHNIVVYVVLAVFLGIWPGWLLLLSLLGFALIFLNAVWMGLLLGLLSARFRDVPLIVSSLLQLAFFVTPILWSPAQIGNKADYLLLNPFYLFLTVFRAPLLGELPNLMVWGELLALTLVGWVVSFLLFARYRGRLTYWI
jgi:ABC-type polysaccharide/polyol phosphate export permease